ncbi:thiol reductant ABC exporter subunit CydD [Tsukamurella sp. 8F]|uniref:thiol reductant ABC exporter subunit CydD n=1 Tax=unclassified Tsukamurella TaxID=2633480 RepID=UPI0023B8C1E0|nr:MULTISPECIES: thiol reductant ABC exporter subunit CydD [unclassified Tsukamurella]MDF0528423.1 thiol reductant ABC exporter subunit CydD [Tsukamurella sp. 8J]MDF0586248.1 thiol reductant ABC exporter subunit CydD [Tsukamurella sp. 8F]
MTTRGPVDPRLWRYARSGRVLLGVVTAAGLVGTACTIVFAACAATMLARIAAEPAERTLAAQGPLLALAGAACAARAAVAYARIRIEHRCAERVVSQLRSASLDAAGRLAVCGREGPEGLRTVVTRGLDDLPPYLTGYVPALALSCTAVPMLIVAIAVADPLSAGIVVGTLPLLPVFMILVGLLTRDRTRRRLDAMTGLSRQLLDLVAGLPTLRALGRERGPEARVRELGERSARETMASLRIAFLSSMVLELLATLCVALVAVGIGLRLVYAEMGLAAGVFALILAPEVYLPLRTVGAQFHAAEQGVSASGRVFALLDAAADLCDSSPDLVAMGTLRVRDLSVAGRDGDAPHRLTAEFPSGVLTVVSGPNGAGKSTLLQVLLGLREPTAGRSDVVDWDRVAWCPQHPVLVSGTLAENFTFLGAPPVDAPESVWACAAVGFDLEWDRVIGADGTGISAGQRQRLALARTLARSAAQPAPRVLLLDEPTAHLDRELETRVLDELRRRAASGDTVVVVAHHASVIAAADAAVDVRAVAHA